MDSEVALAFDSGSAFREIFQSMSEGIVIVQEDGVIVAVNPVAERMFGYAATVMVGMKLESLLPQRLRDRHLGYRKAFNAHPEPRRMGVGRDLTALRKDGKEFPVEISLSFTKVESKILVMAFISDISLRKGAEDALKRSEEQLIVYAAELEKKVFERTETLDKTVENLKREVTERKRAEEEAQNALERERELNELKSKFVSIASHEFRTPLSTVMSSASLVQQYHEKGDDERVKKHIQRIRSSVDHLTSILNDFLSLGKLEEGKIEISREVIRLEEFFEEIKEELRPILKKGQQLKTTCQADPPTFSCDTRIMRNILFNLISNASKYSDPEKSIYVSCKSAKNTMVFEIRDEGIGIPLQDQKHMFDRFFRASNAGNVQGTGLGLNIVKRYLDLLDGEIEFESKPGEGTTFIFTLPNHSFQK